MEILKTLTDDELCHQFKCASATRDRKYEPFMRAIEAERKLRGKVKSIETTPLNEQQPQEQPDETNN